MRVRVRSRLDLLQVLRLRPLFLELGLVRVMVRVRVRARARARFRVRVKARVPQRRHTLGLVAASGGSGALEGRLRGSMYRGPTPAAAARSATACPAAPDGLFVGAFGEAD